MPRTRPLAVAAALAALILPAAAQGAPIAVTTTGDGPNPPGCSLREAVESANGNIGVGGCAAGSASGTDVITLGTGTYTLTHHGAKDNQLGAGGTGDLDVGGNGVTIVGAGALTTIIDGDAADRVFDFLAGTSELREVTVRNGKTPDGAPGGPASMVGDDSLGGSGESAEGSGVDDGDGGGIRNAGSLTLARVTVVGNYTGAGGAASAAGTGVTNPGGNGGAAVGGSGGSGGNGGGIANEADGKLTVNDSVVSDNFTGNGGGGGAGGQAGGGDVGGTSQSGGGGAGGNGGGIYQEGGAGSRLTIARSVVTGNAAGNGGAAGAGGTGGAGASPGASTAGQGGQGGEGGGVYVGGGSAMDVSTTTIDQNLAGDGGQGGQGGTAGGAPDAGGLSSGGRGGNGGGGGGLKTFADSNTIQRSAVTRNGSGYGSNGGDVDNSNKGSTRLGGDGGDAGNGGGLDLGGPTELFSDSTIASNAASGAGDGGAAAAGTGTATPGTAGDGGTGGGVEIESSAPDVHLTHLTIASNFQGAGASAGRAGGLDHEFAANPPVLENTILANNSGGQCGGTTSDGGHNLSFPDPPISQCAATTHTDPLLGALGPHGGPTETMQLLPGSPAIDAAGTGLPCTSVDQRGVTRPRGTECDIGAVERSVPSAVTGGANSIQARRATAGGVVDPGQLPTTYFFRFGRTTAYGSKTPTASAGQGVDVVALASLRDLVPNTLYHIRLFATNPDGSATGADKTFRTKPLRFPGVRIRTGATTVRNGVARIELACPTRQSVIGHCNGTLALRKRVNKRTVGVGSVKFSIRPGKTKPVKVPLSAAGRTLLAQRGKVTVTATARAVDGRGGKPKVSSRKVTLKAP